jgi:hypothetical protein
VAPAMFLPCPRLVSILFIPLSISRYNYPARVEFPALLNMQSSTMAFFMQRNWEGLSVQFWNIPPRHLHHDLRHLQTVGSGVDEVKICALPVASGYIIDMSPWSPRTRS